MDFHAEAAIADEFLKFVMNGALYRGSKPVMWSPVEKTALAEAEVEYHDHQATTIWVKFPVRSPIGDGTAADGARAIVVIWTTTPWTIPPTARSPTTRHRLRPLRVDAAAEDSWAQPSATAASWPTSSPRVC